MNNYRIRFTCENFDYTLVFNVEAQNEKAAVEEFIQFSSECSCGDSHEIVSVEDKTNEAHQ